MGNFTDGYYSDFYTEEKEKYKNEENNSVGREKEYEKLREELEKELEKERMERERVTEKLRENELEVSILTERVERLTLQNEDLVREKSIFKSTLEMYEEDLSEWNDYRSLKRNLKELEKENNINTQKVFSINKKDLKSFTLTGISNYSGYGIDVENEMVMNIPNTSNNSADDDDSEDDLPPGLDDVSNDLDDTESSLMEDVD